MPDRADDAPERAGGSGGHDAHGLPHGKGFHRGYAIPNHPNHQSHRAQSPQRFAEVDSYDDASVSGASAEDDFYLDDDFDQVLRGQSSHTLSGSRASQSYSPDVDSVCESTTTTWHDGNFAIFNLVKTVKLDKRVLCKEKNSLSKRISSKIS